MYQSLGPLDWGHWLWKPNFFLPQHICTSVPSACIPLCLGYCFYLSGVSFSFCFLLFFWGGDEFYLFFFGFSEWHMEVPRLGTELELQLPACTTATAMSDPSLICDLHHSSWQCQILNPLKGPEMEPASSWILVEFLTTELQQELLRCQLQFYCQKPGTLWFLLFLCLESCFSIYSYHNLFFFI